MKNKKAELTTQQIVSLIILVASFAVILFFIIKINFIDTADKEICRNSVIMRDKSGIEAPLKCKINYLCLTSNGKCDKMTNPNIEEVKNKGEVYNILANQIVDCWWMFGEGKINYAGKEIITGKHCAICSQILFDESLNENIFQEGKIDKNEFYNYFATEKMKNNEKTYFEYFYGTKNKEEIYDGDFGYMEIGKFYWIITGVNSEIDFSKWGTGAGIAAGAVLAYFSPVAIGVGAGYAIVKTVGIIKTAGTIGTVGGIGGYFLGSIVEGESGKNFLFPTIIESNPEMFNVLNCSEMRSMS